MHNAKMIKHSRKKRLLATMLSVALLLSLPLPASASTGNINANVVADSLAVAKQVEAEGIVLLKNEGPVLPLAAEKGINVFGSASIDPYYGSSGSGSIKSDTLIGFYDGLRLAGIHSGLRILRHSRSDDWKSRYSSHIPVWLFLRQSGSLHALFAVYPEQGKTALHKYW